MVQRMPYRPYCSNNLASGIFVNSKEKAISQKYIQFNPPSQMQAFCIDLDNDYSFETADIANVLPPSILIQNPRNGHGHALYLLESPISLSTNAKMAPQRFLAAVERGYARRMSGDIGYAGLLCRNPITHPIIDSGAIYSLKELDSWLDFEDKAPYYNIQTEHGAGRNVEMFNTVRKWSYLKVKDFSSRSLFHDAVLTKCREINSAFNHHLPDSEPRAAAKSIAKWTWKRRGEFSEKRRVNRGAYACSRKEAGVITAARVKAASAIKIEHAVRRINASGKKITVALIASVAGVTRPTVYAWMKRAPKV